MLSEISKSAAYVLTSLLTVLLLAACTTDEPTTSEPVRMLTLQSNTGPRDDVDEDFESINALVPGFGGLTLTSSGAVRLYLKRGSDRELATTIAASYLSQIRPKQFAGGIKPEFATAEFEWSDLLASKRAAVDLLNDPEVVFLDADESRNRVVIAVASDAAEANARAYLQGRSISIAPYVFLRAQPLRPLVILKDSVRPLRGGLALGWQSGFTGSSCTLGSSAFPSPANGNVYFVTNSHCSLVRGQVEASYYQPIGSQYVGLEVSDPR
ncbi:MAG: hypothetical protein ACT443_00775 [Gemmatimonadota bacterium]